MKISSLILVILAVSLAAILAFWLGRLFERMATISAEVGDLQDRVFDLEQVNTRREIKWGWIKRIAAHMPLAGKHINEE